MTMMKGFFFVRQRFISKDLPICWSNDKANSDELYISTSSSCYSRTTYFSILLFVKMLTFLNIYTSSGNTRVIICQISVTCLCWFKNVVVYNNAAHRIICQGWPFTFTLIYKPLVWSPQFTTR